MDMGDSHLDFADLLEEAAGRGSAADSAHLASCARCREQLAGAERLLDAGRRAVASPAPSQRLLARAVRLFREADSPRLRLAFDSFLHMAPALRSLAAAPPRFLRFEGAATVELQVSRTTRGFDVRGQVTPADFTKEVAFVAGPTVRRAKVESDGSFLLRRLARGCYRLEAGAAAFDALEL
ncbi:MAG: hypothetical protein ACT4PV_15905 [Planctomycetaceae bacterium]